MKTKIFAFLFAILITYIFFVSNVFWAISLQVSPIKYEIEAQTWTTVYKTAIVANKSDDPIHLYTWKSDFTSNQENWIVI